jgi:hypothetical protein
MVSQNDPEPSYTLLLLSNDPEDGQYVPLRISNLPINQIEKLASPTTTDKYAT